MNLQDLKNEVNYINQNATRKSFEILIQLLESTGFAVYLKDAELSAKMSEQFEKTVEGAPAVQPKMEQEDQDAQMQDGEEIPDADIVEQSEIDPAKYPQDVQAEKEYPVFDSMPDVTEEKAPIEDAEGFGPQNRDLSTGDQTMDQVTITADDVSELPVELLEDQKTVMGVTDEGTTAHYKNTDVNKEK